MKNVVILFCLIFTLLNGNIINDLTFSELKNLEWDLPVQPTIGGWTYNKLAGQDSDFRFTVNIRVRIPSNSEFPYPLIIIVPKGNISPSPIILKQAEKSQVTSQPTLAIIEAIINGLVLSSEESSFQIENAMTMRDSGEIKNFQMIIAWSSTKTYLMLNFGTKDDLDMFQFEIGRGLPQYNFSNDIPITNGTNGRLVYDITSNVMTKIGCQPIPDAPDIRSKGTYQLRLSKYRWSGLGGEMIYIQGPCTDKYYGETRKLEIKKDGIRIRLLDLDFDDKRNSFKFISPYIWNPGVYELKLQFRDTSFINDVEIYSYQDRRQKYSFYWNESHLMNNPDFNQTEIFLSFPKPNFHIQSLVFTILNLHVIDSTGEPMMSSNKILPQDLTEKDNWFQINTKLLFNSAVDILQGIGFFSLNDINNEIYWSKPFSLIWLTNIYQKNYTESICRNFMPKINNDYQYNCPTNSEKMIGLQTKFRKIEINDKFLTNDLTEYDCFVQVLWGSSLQQQKGRGVTCCYFKDTKYLVYGQDFYLRNGSTFGSYSWSVPPTSDVLKHFVFDRVPLLACCVLIKNESICLDYWSVQHQISLDYNSNMDLNGDIFGFAHVIPFKATSNYSFAGQGQFDLIATKDNEFQLQGIFFNDIFSRTASLLIGISLKSPLSQITITSSSNNATDLKWKILLKKINGQSLETILALPFKNEDLYIYQSDDQMKLFIYIYIKDNFNIFIEIERSIFYNTLMEYLNMKISFSNSFQSTIMGGLFGIVDNKPDSTSLYKRNSREFVTANNLASYNEMFEFAKTWESQTNANLFLDLNFKMSPKSFNIPTLNPDPLCQNVSMCNIDKQVFKDDTIFNTTLAAYNWRKSLENHLVSGITEGNVCDHPKWKQIKLTSYSFMENQNITISGCADPLLKMKNPYQILSCQKSSNGTLSWWQYPPFDGEFCESPYIEPTIGSSTEPSMGPTTGTVTQTSTPDIVMYASIGAAVMVLILVSFIILVILICSRKRKLRSNSKVALGTSISSNLPPNDIYENYAQENLAIEEEYVTYAEIQKQFKNTGV